MSDASSFNGPAPTWLRHGLEACAVLLLSAIVLPLLLLAEGLLLPLGAGFLAALLWMFRRGPRARDRDSAPCVPIRAPAALQPSSATV